MKSLRPKVEVDKEQTAKIRKASPPKPKAPEAQPELHKFGHFIGNRALGRLIQAKLTVGAPHDQYEQEADRVADRIMRMPQPGIQRQAGPEEEEEEAIQTKPLDTPITSVVQRQSEEEEEEKVLQSKPLSTSTADQVQRQEEPEEEEEEPVQTKLLDTPITPRVQRQTEEEDEEEETPVQTKPLDTPITPLVQRQTEEEEEEEETPLQSKLLSTPATDQLQRQAEPEEEEEEEEPVQAKPASNTSAPITSSVQTKIQALKGSGQPLAASERAFFEPRFGRDFSRVRIHTDSRAHHAARAINARAFTHGRNIVFGEGQYSPSTSSGRHLMAHELTHTLQQSRSSVRRVPKYGGDLKSPRFRGNAVLEKVLDKLAKLKKGSRGTAVELVQQALVDAGFPLPKYGVDGIFGSETKGAVKKYQRANALYPDGVVGHRTMGALDLYFGVDLGPKPLPPKAGSNEAKIIAILSKGSAMSAKEADDARSLLYALDEDEFRRVLKAVIVHPEFVTWLKKLGLIKVFTALRALSLEVVIPTTLLTPATNTIGADFTRANQIYNPHGIEIEQGPEKTLTRKQSRKVIGRNLILHEFSTARATSEELKLIKHNRMKDRMTGYWVPNMRDSAGSSSRGEALMKSHLTNMPDNRESVVVNTSSRAADTFAHEVGHVMGLEHTNVDSIADTVADDPDNLMTRGAHRNVTGAGIDQITAGQLAVLRRSLFMAIGKKGVGK